MSTPKPDHFVGSDKMIQRKPAQHEEIEWTDEDDKIMDQVMAKLRAKGVKADPVHPVRRVKKEA